MKLRFCLPETPEREEEQQILDKGYDLSATVLKVGHHGSRNSTTYPFLREIMPEYAVISVGKDNTYGHPTEDVLSRLGDAGAKVYRTDIQGDIIAVSNRSYRNYNTSQNADADTLSAQRDVTTPKTEAKGDTVEAGYIGNSKTKKFHLPSCKTLPAEHNRMYFDTRDNAIQAGYTLCGNCHP